MTRFLSFVIAASLFLPLSASAADYFTGMDALARHDGAAALREFTPLAQIGDADAEDALGLVLELGEGLPPKPAEAVMWYRRAADLGLLAGMTDLGRMLDRGFGVPKNDVEALRWYSLAANHGSAYGMLMVGSFYENGRVVAADPVAGMAWMLKSAQGGNIVGMFETGRLILHAPDPATYPEGRIWIQKAADAGYPKAQALLGLAKLGGMGGFTIDREDGVRLLRLAAEKNDPDAADGLASAYHGGLGVAPSETEADHWLQRAVTLGSVTGQTEFARRKLAASDPAGAFFWGSVAERKALPGNKAALDKIVSDSARQLSPAQQAEQGRLAASWVPGH